MEVVDEWSPSLQRHERSIQQIPLGTSGFPLPKDIDPIPSGELRLVKQRVA